MLRFLHHPEEERVTVDVLVTQRAALMTEQDQEELMTFEACVVAAEKAGASINHERMD